MIALDLAHRVAVLGLLVVLVLLGRALLRYARATHAIASRFEARVRADDELVERIRRGELDPEDETPLTLLMTEWRDDAATTDPVLPVLAPGERPAGQHRRSARRTSSTWPLPSRRRGSSRRPADR